MASIITIHVLVPGDDKDVVAFIDGMNDTLRGWTPGTPCRGAVADWAYAAPIHEYQYRQQGVYEEGEFTAAIPGYTHLKL